MHSKLLKAFCETISLQLDFKMCPDQTVLFDQNEIKLDIPEQGVKLESGWSITPLSTTVVSFELC